MDLNRLANIAEIFGTVAIVVSLIYVAIQIRQNTQATKLAAAQNLSHDLREVLANIHSDPELAQAYLRGMQDVTSLSNEEKFRVYIFLLNYLRAFENAYYQFKNGVVDEYVWDGYLSNVLFTKGTSCHKSFWNDRQQIFSKEFQDFYNGLATKELPDPVAPYKDSGSS